ncbi:hypothetical protein Tco_1330097 [Tanacetum coccineum]
MGESSRSITSSSLEIAALTQQIAEMNKNFLRMSQSNQQVNVVNPSCETCGGPHHYFECQAAGGFTQGDVYAATKNYNAVEGLVSEFMASQDARLSKFEANFKRQQGEMTNKIDTVLKAITDQIAGTLPSDTVKNPKLGTHPISSTRSYPTEDLQCSTYIHSSINAITIHPKQQSDSHDRTEENEEEERGNSENHPDSPIPPDPSISFIT